MKLDKAFDALLAWAIRMDKNTNVIVDLTTAERTALNALPKGKAFVRRISRAFEGGRGLE